MVDEMKDDGGLSRGLIGPLKLPLMFVWRRPARALIRGVDWYYHVSRVSRSPLAAHRSLNISDSPINSPQICVLSDYYYYVSNWCKFGIRTTAGNTKQCNN
jgi:hypothetical protein